MTVFSYMRNNYPLKNIDQIKLLSQYECEDIRVEAQELSIDSELKQLANDLKENDTLVVPSLLSFGKNIGKLAPFIETFQEKGIHLILIEEKITVSLDSVFYEQFSAINFLESNIRSTISKQGIERSRNEPGVILGRPKISTETVEEIHYLYQQKYSLREISEKCKVSLGSVHKYVQQSIEQNKLTAEKEPTR